jgi:hypothetical protein
MRWDHAADVLETATAETVQAMDEDIRRLIRTRNMLAAALNADGDHVPPFELPSNHRPASILLPQAGELGLKPLDTVPAQIARLINTEGPRRLGEICTALGKSMGHISVLIRTHPWFVKVVSTESRSPYTLTTTGVAARPLWEIPSTSDVSAEAS